MSMGLCKVARGGWSLHRSAVGVGLGEEIRHIHLGHGIGVKACNALAV